MDFMGEPQDARGLPLSWSDDAEINSNCGTWDYDSIPDVVASNGREDWPFRLWEPLLTA